MKIFKSVAAWLVGFAVIGILFWPVYANPFATYVPGLSGPPPGKTGNLSAALMLLIGVAGFAGTLARSNKTMPLSVALISGFAFSFLMLVLCLAISISIPLLGVSWHTNSATLKTFLSPVVFPLALIFGAAPSLAFGSRKQK